MDTFETRLSAAARLAVRNRNLTRQEFLAQAGQFYDRHVTKAQADQARALAGSEESVNRFIQLMASGGTPR